MRSSEAVLLEALDRVVTESIRLTTSRSRGSILRVSYTCAPSLSDLSVASLTNRGPIIPLAEGVPYRDNSWIRCQSKVTAYWRSPSSLSSMSRAAPSSPAILSLSTISVAAFSSSTCS